MGSGWSSSYGATNGQKMDVQEVLSTAQTGDVLLVSGTERLSTIIKKATRSKWSHTGILVRDPPAYLMEKYGVATRRGDGFRNPCDSHKLEKIFLFDSDFEDDQSVQGPTLRPLCDVLYNYLGEHYFGLGVVVAVREVSWKNDSVKERGLPPDAIPLLWPFMEEVFGKRFESMDAAGYAELVASILSLNRREDQNCFFCSELVAETFQRLKLVPEKKDGGDHSNNFTPQHMSPNHKLDKYLRKTAVSLGPLRTLSGMDVHRAWVEKTYPQKEEKEEGQQEPKGDDKVFL